MRLTEIAFITHEVAQFIKAMRTWRHPYYSYV